MLLNLSNHPSASWPVTQLAAAGGESQVLDMPFPTVDPSGDEAYIESLADEYLDKIISTKDVTAVHIMGEMNFTYAMVNRLKANGIRCLASTTKRETVEENGVKISKFNFVKFREY